MSQLNLADVPVSSPFDPRLVDDYSDAELDAQPFGVIGLDLEGTILRYNLYESRFARLDRNQVIGRNFFSEVALCTRTEAFEGRFWAFVRDPSRPTERFEFVFNFKFGVQRVSVELVRAPGVDRYYLLINRQEVAAPQPDFPTELLAVAQQDLAPDEAQQGVVRDALQRRYAEVPAHFFAALRVTCDRLAPDTWQLFSSEWGVQWGRRAAVDLEAAALESSGKSLREIPMREVAHLISSYLHERGWGSLVFDFSRTAEGIIQLDLERSVLAEAAPAPARRSSTTRSYQACSLVAGFLSGTLSTVADRRLAAREIRCAASGASVCQFLLVGHERRGALDVALREGGGSLETVINALRRAPPVSTR
jgi:photoactive yellow protein